MGETEVDEHKQPLSQELELNAKPLAARTGCEGDQACILGSTVAQFTISVKREDVPKITEDLSGYLLIETGEVAVSEAATLSLTPKGDEAKAFGFWQLGFATIIRVGLIAGVLECVLSFVVLFIKYPGSFVTDWQALVGGHLGPITWDFSKNWAATLTVFAGVAGSIYGLTILPEATNLLTKTEKINEYVILPAIFALGAAMAPLVGTLCTTFFPKRGQPGAARVWVYVLAVSLIVFTTMGQTLVGLVFLDEVRQGSVAYKSMAILLEVMLLILGLAVFVYAIVKTVGTVLEIIRKQKQPGALRALKRHILAARDTIDSQYIATVNALRDQVDPLRWALDSLEGTPRDEEPKRVTVAVSCERMLQKLYDYSDEGNDGLKKARACLG